MKKLTNTFRTFNQLNTFRTFNQLKQLKVWLLYLRQHFFLWVYYTMLI